MECYLLIGDRILTFRGKLGTGDYLTDVTDVLDCELRKAFECLFGLATIRSAGSWILNFKKKVVN